MPYLILLVAVLIGLALIAYAIRGLTLAQVTRALKWPAAGVGFGLLVFLTISGRMAALSWLAAVFLPLLLRWRQIARAAKAFGGPREGQTSDVETRYLRMRLEHDSGTLDGTVLAGPFRGRALSELLLDELIALLRDCRAEDEPSVPILESYIDRIHGPDWRGSAAGATAEGAAPPSTAQGKMTPREAYQILDLKPGASKETIKDAHRRLMLKLHPDQGGSTYLAAQINQAKDLLLRE